MKKSFNYFQIKFASLKKFSTFAVPNKTGADQRMLKRQINKIETTNNRKGSSGLTKTTMELKTKGCNI